MNVQGKRRIVVLGMMSRHPQAGMVWLTAQYLVGFERLGFEVYYVEAHGGNPKTYRNGGPDNSHAAADFIGGVMRRFGMKERWAFHALHSDGRCYGMSESELKSLYRSASLLLNLHGGTTPLPEHCGAAPLVYVGTDPVATEIALHQGAAETIELLSTHSVLFTWAENYGNPDCRLPVSPRFQFFPTRQPVVLDFWRPRGKGSGNGYGNGTRMTFTTIGSWRQLWRELEFQGEVYHWSKHFEFLKFISLPERTGVTFELALANCPEPERRALLERGWRVRDALELSEDLDVYRNYISASEAEFTVAKDQNVRFRSGWFSDRSAAYLAAGKPVVTQDTGFSNILPTGEGLFQFSTMEEIQAAVERVEGDYARHSRAAAAIADEFFDYRVVLPQMLREAGL